MNKEKVYITAGFFITRYVLGYLNHAKIPSKIPLFVTIFLSAIDFVVSLPMKLIMATPVLKAQLQRPISYFFLLVILIVYWYVFACILYYAYETLNKEDSEEKKDSQEKADVQKTLV